MANLVPSLPLFALLVAAFHVLSLASAMRLELPTEFAEVPDISLEDRRQIVQNVLRIATQVNPQIDLQRELYGVSPERRLQAILRQLRTLPENDTANAYEFHREIGEVVDMFRDLNFKYFPPAPFDSYDAALPFLVEEYMTEVDGKMVRKFVISRIRGALLRRRSAIKRGDEIISWNGIAINRFFKRLVASADGTSDAYSERLAITQLGRRWLAFEPLPKAATVRIVYKNADGEERKETFTWKVVRRDGDALDLDPVPSSVADAEGPTPSPIDFSSVANSAECTRILFGGATTQRMQTSRLIAQVHQTEGDHRGSQSLNVPKELMVDSRMSEDVTITRIIKRSAVGIRTGTLVTESGDLGYIDLISIRFSNFLEYLNIFAEAVREAPAAGLVIDLRGNTGGSLVMADLFAQFFTNDTVMPMVYQSRVSPTLREMAAQDAFFFLNTAAKSILVGSEWGARYSAQTPLIDLELPNCVDPAVKFFGPVAVLVNSGTVTAAEVAAANLQDAGVGIVIGEQDQTGGLGSSNFPYEELEAAFPGVLDNTPLGVSIQVPFQRAFRTNENIGIPLQYYGVTPDIVVQRTKRDILEGSIDFLNKVGEILTEASGRR